MTAALQFRDLTLGYDRHPAVHHLDGAIETGALVAVVGPNGAGKSTLFKGIVGLIKPLAHSKRSRRNARKHRRPLANSTARASDRDDRRQSNIKTSRRSAWLRLATRCDHFHVEQVRLTIDV